MSPIRPEQRVLYAPNWPELSIAIRKNRAHDRCECDGRCGREIPQHVAMSDLAADLAAAGFGSRRCTAKQNEPSQISGKPVVLTVAHLDHDPTNNARTNLCAMCQACHLAYDAEHHAETRAATRASTPSSVLDNSPEGNTMSTDTTITIRIRQIQGGVTRENQEDVIRAALELRDNPAVESIQIAGGRS